MSLTFIFVLVALVFFALAALNVPLPRVNSIGCGLFFLTLSQVVTR